jgi:hypothetical protein
MNHSERKKIVKVQFDMGLLSVVKESVCVCVCRSDGDQNPRTRCGAAVRHDQFRVALTC